jgi:hypothetical protein
MWLSWMLYLAAAAAPLWLRPLMLAAGGHRLAHSYRRAVGPTSRSVKAPMANAGYERRHK